MYTNGNRFTSGSGTKRKQFEDGDPDFNGAMPPKMRLKQHNYEDYPNTPGRAKQQTYDDSAAGRTSQHSYGEHMNSTSRTASAKQHSYGDHFSQSTKQHSYSENSSGRPTVSKQHNYSDSTSSSSRGISSKQHHYADSMNSSSRSTPSKQHNYSDSASTPARAAQTGNQHNYGESSSNNKQHSNSNQRENAAVGTSKQYISSNHYSYDGMGPPPPPPNQYDNKGPMQQYGFKQDAINQGGHQTAPFPPGPGRYGQQMSHNGMVGHAWGWNQRGRGPMRGFRGNQWPPPGHAPGPLVHPHMGHMVPPLIPPGPYAHPPPPRGYFGAHLGPRPVPLFGLQANPNAGRNQPGSHQKSKNKKRQEDANSVDANVVPPKMKGGVLLTPENKPVAKARKRNVLPAFPSRPWNRDDAEKALKVEVETTLNLKNESLIIRFPDPELSRDIVKTYHPGIQNVHFQVPSGPRYCFVQLAPDVNVEKTIKILENIKFGSGHLSVEKKSTKQEEEASPESIDPYTLYIGNLPTNVNIQTVKEKFPDAARVDVGFAQRMRYTRYAFIRFNSVDDAIKAYKENHNLVLDSRSIIVRFRRQKGQIDLPGESKPQQPAKVNVRTADFKKTDDDSKNGKVKKETKDEEDENDDDEEDEDEEDDEEENVDDDDDDDDDDDGEGEAEDDDDDDDDEEDEGRKPLQDDDDDDDEDDHVAGPPLPPDDDDDDDDDNIFRELDAKLGGYSGFPFNFN